MSVTMTVGTVELSIDGRSVLVPSGSTVLDAARTLGIDIPVLCHAQEQTPVGVCRVRSSRSLPRRAEDSTS